MLVIHTTLDFFLLERCVRNIIFVIIKLLNNAISNACIANMATMLNFVFLNVKLFEKLKTCEIFREYSVPVEGFVEC